MGETQESFDLAAYDVSKQARLTLDMNPTASRGVASSTRMVSPR